MAGDEESAVSVIRLVEELDAGPIGAWHDLSIGGDTTAGDVYAEVARLAPELIDEALANDSFSPQVGEPTYAEKIGPADRELDWSRPAKELHDRIRALSPHIGARGEVEGRQRDRLARPARRRPPRVARGAAGRRDPHVLRRVAPRLTLLTMGWTDWVRGLEIEPSIYAADFSRLGEQLETVMSAGARIFQFDVGDGQFVEPITIGPIVLKSISPLVHELGGVLDCHLMIVTPEKHFEAIAEAGGDSVTVHYEVCDDLPGVIAQARELGLGVGVAFNPETEPDAVAEAAGGLVDLVLCMSIHPGYSGQPFMPESIPRVRRLRELLPDDVHIQVDGGVGPDNVRELREAGASLLVAGTSVFGQEDIAAAYREPRRALMLERAVELAERGRGTTHPNPVVGAVVVRDGEVVGEGWHERQGRAARRGRRARGSRRGGPRRDAVRDARAVRPPRHDAAVRRRDPRGRDREGRRREPRIRRATGSHGCARPASRSSWPISGRRARRTRPGSPGRGSGGRS